MYNNKIHSAIKVSSFKANYEQDPRIEFKERRKGNFVEKIRKIWEKAKIALGKVQEEIRKYTDRKWQEAEEYKVKD